MTKFISAVLSLFLLLFIPPMLQSSKIFPYDYKVEVLENGMKVISIPLNNPHIISHYVIIRSGSRNEIESPFHKYGYSPSKDWSNLQR